jgi:hypothetical protein
MRSSDIVEHFVTLFDSHYLPQGLALHRSLLEHARPFKLWIVCMDESVEQALRKLDLSGVTLLPLKEVETVRLREVKSVRSIGEYCWTLTPFVPQSVFQVAPHAQRVTYLDADLFFFDSPRILLDELDRSGKDVLITDHAYAPEYSSSRRFGRFCVQFMTFRNTAAGMKVLRWWQERCLEWCYARDEDGKFGDQKYLEDWPTRYADEVHVLEQVERTLAPWNVHFFARTNGGANPVFYHFHGLKLYRPTRVRLFTTYRIGRRNMWIYDRYVEALKDAMRRIRTLGLPVQTLALEREPLYWLRRPKWYLQGRLRYTTV